MKERNRIWTGPGLLGSVDSFFISWRSIFSRSLRVNNMHSTFTAATRMTMGMAKSLRVTWSSFGHRRPTKKPNQPLDA